MSKAAELYEKDFFAWTQKQAAVLRSKFRGDNRLDVEHLAEEVEGLGRAELNAVESYIEQIIAHLLKLDFSGLSEPRDHWRREIEAFRMSLRRRITPSIRRRIEDSLPELYGNAVWLAGRRLAQTEPDFAERPPKVCPYSLGMIEGSEPPRFPDLADHSDIDKA
jgi:hypothetical protein